jgi:hypothetical protein
MTSTVGPAFASQPIARLEDATAATHEYRPEHAWIVFFDIFGEQPDR